MDAPLKMDATLKMDAPLKMDSHLNLQCMSLPMHFTEKQITRLKLKFSNPFVSET